MSWFVLIVLQKKIMNFPSCAFPVLFSSIIILVFFFVIQGIRVVFYFFMWHFPLAWRAPLSSPEVSWTDEYLFLDIGKFV